MVVHEYLRYLVIETKLVSYEYFMDEMKEWEIVMLAPMGIDAHRTDWETARYISYNNAMFSGNIKKQYSEKPMQELLPLPYDKEQGEEHNIEMTNKQRDMLSERARLLSQKIKQKKLNG